jgi:hypothetical protein
VNLLVTEQTLALVTAEQAETLRNDYLNTEIRQWLGYWVRREALRGDQDGDHPFEWAFLQHGLRKKPSTRWWVQVAPELMERLSQGPSWPSFQVGEEC